MVTKDNTNSSPQLEAQGTLSFVPKRSGEIHITGLSHVQYDIIMNLVQSWQ